jgi:hypothetical protein
LLRNCWVQSSYFEVNLVVVVVVVVVVVFIVVGVVVVVVVLVSRVSVLTYYCFL